jgi:hypothetical protein
MVARMPIFLTTLGCAVEDDEPSTVIVCTACVVWTTHTGLTKMVVAEPAIVPVEKVGMIEPRAA